LNGEYRIDRIEDVVNRYLTDKTGIVECKDDLRIFGFDKDLRPQEKRVARVVKAHGPKELLKIKIKGNRELLVTPNHRFFVFKGTKEFEVRTADELRSGDLIPVATKVPLARTTSAAVNLAREILAFAPKADLFSWRVRGDDQLKKAIAESYDLILHAALTDGYTYRAIWLWPRRGILPLKYLGLLSLSPEAWDSLEIGRGRRGGGRIQFLPARVEVDDDLGFFLGFYAGDGSATGNMVRFGIGMSESEIVGKLLDILFHKFRLIGSVFKERKANMWVLQVNSLALKEILKLVFGVGWSSESGKLIIPRHILNGPEEVRWAFLAGLIASDGYVDKNADWSFIASANRDFIRQIGFLALTLGLSTRFRSMRPNDFPLHAVDLKTSEIHREIWLKDFHRERAERIENEREPKNTFALLPVKSVETIPYENPLVYCFEVEDDLHGFVTVDGTFVGQSFGYQGYKNARFGRIECHEAINAYARDILVRTMEIAESHGYEVVHGIVDSVWLRAKPDADPIEKVREHIAGSVGLPIELEGRYKWIVFLPCKTTGVGALNRYYGLFEHDEFKLRGIELRKHDTPDFINICQEAMLGELSLASNAAEFRERIPRAVDILRWTVKRVLDRAIPVHQFILTKNVSRALPEYVVLTATAAALKQMADRGYTVEPGETVRYVLLDARARESWRKVRVAEFLQGDEEPDAWEYIRLLCRSGQTLLAPFGYTEEKLVAMCRDLSDVPARPPERAIAVQEDYKSVGHSRARGGVGYRKPWRVQTDEESPGEDAAEF
jgi:intein/homing endonuclease